MTGRSCVFIGWRYRQYSSAQCPPHQLTVVSLLAAQQSQGRHITDTILKLPWPSTLINVRPMVKKIEEKLGLLRPNSIFKKTILDSFQNYLQNQPRKKVTHISMVWGHPKAWVPLASIFWWKLGLGNCFFMCFLEDFFVHVGHCFVRLM